MNNSVTAEELERLFHDSADKFIDLQVVSYLDKTFYIARHKDFINHKAFSWFIVRTDVDDMIFEKKVYLNRKRTKMILHRYLHGTKLKNIISIPSISEEMMMIEAEEAFHSR